MAEVEEFEEAPELGPEHVALVENSSSWVANDNYSWMDLFEPDIPGEYFCGNTCFSWRPRYVRQAHSFWTTDLLLRRHGAWSDPDRHSSGPD